MKSFWTAAIAVLALFPILELRSEEASSPAVKAAEAWVALLDAGKYDQSWKQAAPVFQTGIKQADWRKAVGSVRKPLGKPISRKLVSEQETPVPGGGPEGMYVVIQFHTDFEQKKGATETITPWRDKDGRWRVSGYYIK
jgi:hypothetical protein